MKPPAAILRRSLRAHQIYGANTEVGKTVITTTLARAAHRRFPRDAVSYLKPVSTGPDDEADQLHLSKYSPASNSHTLFQYALAESPHSAAPPSGLPIPSDTALLHAVAAHAAAAPPGWLFVETAGGPHSPGPSGTTQVELFKPLRLPAVLVGDAKLGGISQTISAYETLVLRGYCVDAVLLFRDARYRNYVFLRDYFLKRGVAVETIDAPPARGPDRRADEHMMRDFYTEQAQAAGPAAVLDRLARSHTARLDRLDSMAAKAHATIWYPFTQQALVSVAGITPIDSAHGNYFQTLRRDAAAPDDSVLQPSFDGSASWWTQGLGHSDTDLALAAAWAAGRYGHVMFAEAIHEPALGLAEEMLSSSFPSPSSPSSSSSSPSSSSSSSSSPSPPKLTRLFYTDNGSSGCEVAVKMALRAARRRYAWSPHDTIDILGLTGSYHGDTMGVMDCADPNTYNEKVEWYTGRGYWFDTPTVLCTRDGWGVGDTRFASLAEVFNLEMREQRGDAQVYERDILETLTRLSAAGRKFGALVMEPVVLGAGGMKLVDPLFQRTLVRLVRSNPHLFGTPADPPSPDSWSGLPVLFDEVFTGLYRLGRFSAASFLGVQPDIVVNAKLLTGGALPLCTTMASEAIFDSFLSADKSDALLHGHSYTAHAMGCQVALEAVRALRGLDEEGMWDGFKRDWSLPFPPPSPSPSPSSSSSSSSPPPTSSSSSSASPWSAWPSAFVHNLPASSPAIHGVWALGSVLALTLRDSSASASASASSYKSTASMALHKALLTSLDGWNVHNRILGNVLYLMVGQRTTAAEMATLCERVQTAISMADDAETAA